jgi:hypothetical protein
MSFETNPISAEDIDEAIANQIIEAVEAEFNIPIQQELKKAFRKSKKFGLSQPEIDRMEDALMCSVANLYNIIDNSLQSRGILVDVDPNVHNTERVYRKVCRGIACVMRPIQIQTRALAPRLECESIISATEFKRRMALLIKESEDNSDSARSAALAITNTHRVEDEWLQHISSLSSCDSDVLPHAWFDVMCFKKKRQQSIAKDLKTSACVKQHICMTTIALLSTVLFLRNKFHLCEHACVCYSKSELFLVAPTQEITIITKCLIPYLHLVVPLHKANVPVNCFLASPLIVDVLSSAPPRSLILKWSLFVLAGLMHRKHDDAIDFLFGNLVTKGCPIRAEAARWRILMLCRYYVHLQRLQETENDPLHQTTEDYVECISDDLLLKDDFFDDDDDFDDDSDTEGADHAVKHVLPCSQSSPTSVNEREKKMTETMCRIKEMTLAADRGLKWSISQDMLNVIMATGTRPEDVPSIFHILKNSTHGSKQRNVLGSAKIKKVVVHNTSAAAHAGANTAEAGLRSPQNDPCDSASSSLSDESDTNSDTASTGSSHASRTSQGSQGSQISRGSRGSQNSENSQHSLSIIAGTVNDVVVLPMDLITSVLCEIAHHPEISNQASSFETIATVPECLDRTNVSEVKINERVQTSQFENKVSKVARNEYRKLYSKQGAGSRSKVASSTEIGRIRNSYGLMKCHHELPPNLHGATLTAIETRWVHKSKSSSVHLDYKEQAFHLMVENGWEALERVLIEYEEALRGFAPGSHNVHGTHDVKRISVSTKRHSYKKRRRIKPERLQRGGAFLWADENVELCVSRNCTTYETFPICADTPISIDVISRFIKRDMLELVTGAYGHAVQPGKLIFPKQKVPLPEPCPQ